MKVAKKLICVVLLFSVIATTIIITASAGSIAFGAGSVSASCLNVRSEPGMSGNIIGTVSRGNKVVILEKTNDEWYNINYNGLSGYVSAQYIMDVAVAENFNVTGEVTGNNVRLRSGPSTSNDIIGEYSKGEKLSVAGINNGWYKVQTDNGAGYIRSDYVTIVSGAGDTAVASMPSNSELNDGVTSSKGSEIAAFAKQYVGYRYVYGAESPSVGFDCSGLVYYVFGQFGYSMERRASLQYAYNGTYVSKDDLQPGDLVFFSSDGGYSVTHVGIYIGNNEFVHASTSKTGVIISRLDSSYYMSVWYGARRVA